MRAMLTKSTRPKKKRQAAYHVSDGEPIVLKLEKWKNSEFLEAAEQSVCCDCDLNHIFHYTVRKTGKNFWLVIRAYRVT